MFGPEAYASGEMFQRERVTLFARHWLVLAAAAQLAQTGDFISHSMGGWPLFAIRGADGAARAFRNTCRHQKMPVVEQASGRCSQLRCRYHGWTYDLQGQFVSAPPPVAPTEPLHLEAVATRERDGLLFARVEPGEGEPPSVATGTFTAAVTTDVACNWKALVEAMLPEGWQLIWPLALTREGVVRQVVPRSFLRTRMVDLVFGADLEAVKGAAEVDKVAAEARHAQLAAEGADVSVAVADFRRQVAEACT